MCRTPIHLFEILHDHVKNKLHPKPYPLLDPKGSGQGLLDICCAGNSVRFGIQYAKTPSPAPRGSDQILKRLVHIPHPISLKPYTVDRPEDIRKFLDP